MSAFDPKRTSTGIWGKSGGSCATKRGCRPGDSFSSVIIGATQLLCPHNAL